MNNVSLTGRIATDLELRTLPGSNTSVIETRLAVRKRSRNKDQDAIFVDVTLYGGAAELLAKYTAKGSRIGITGRIEVDQWTAEDDSPRSRTYVVAEELEFLDSARHGEPASAQAI